MADRLELQSKFEELLGSRNVYYQPPENLKMNYPAIRYSLSGIENRPANNNKYLTLKRYDGIVISKKVDPEIIEHIAVLKYVTIGRPYIAENLYHYPFTIYY